MRFFKETISTANRAITAVQSVADAVIALPEAIHEARSILVEQSAEKHIKLVKLLTEKDWKIDELEIDIRKLREHNHGLAEEGDRLKTRIAELESELNHNSLALSFWSNWVHELCGGNTGESDIGFDAANRIKIETELATSRTESLFRAKAEPSIPEPDAKPWLACTAEEARANPVESETMRNGTWRKCDEYCRNFVPGCAYRSTAKLPEWVASANRDIVTLGHYRGTASKGIVEYFRSAVKVGTVLG